MLTPVRVSAPATTPVSLAEAKAHLRVDHTDDDTRIASLIQAATDHFDGWNGILGRALVTQTWRADFSCFPRAGRLRLPLTPVQSITSIAYWDLSNSDQTWNSAQYTLYAGHGGTYVLGYSWPSIYGRADAIRVTFIAGYGDATAVPQPIKAAILFYVEMLYEGADPSKYQFTIDSLTAPYRDLSLAI
jgi:uncharacterized phiE125 gp8 family phage protein